MPMRRAEVIVVGLILAVGFSLAVIAARKGNETAFRTQCSMNLRQIGLSLSSYADTFKRFPAGTVPNRGLPPRRRLSWMWELHPYVESDTLYRDTDRRKAWDARANRPIACTGVRTYLCPANPDQQARSGEFFTHYVGVAGVGKEAATLRRGHPRAGFFRYEPDEVQGDLALGLRREDIKDELGTTLAVVETDRDNGPWLAGGFPTVRGLDRGGSAYLGEAGQFGSRHRHGSHALFADTSVRFLPDSLSPQVFEAMATISGREEVGPFEE
jgi:hypothetical protein